MVAEVFTIILGVFYVLFFINSLFSSSKFLMLNQSSYFGRLLFIVYSLLVYVKGLRIPILFWDVFVNDPIVFGFSHLDLMLDSLFGFTIIADPVNFVVVFLGASFVYNFLRYWFDYGFRDERISKLMAFAAVFLFIKQGGHTGLLHKDLISLSMFSTLFPGLYLLTFFTNLGPNLVAAFSVNGSSLLSSVIVFIVSGVVLLSLYFLCFKIFVVFYAVMAQDVRGDRASVIAFGIFLLFLASYPLAVFLGVRGLDLFLGLGSLFIISAISVLADLLMFGASFMLFSSLKNLLGSSGKGEN